MPLATGVWQLQTDVMRARDANYQILTFIKIFEADWGCYLELN